MLAGGRPHFHGESAIHRRVGEVGRVDGQRGGRVGRNPVRRVAVDQDRPGHGGDLLLTGDCQRLIVRGDYFQRGRGEGDGRSRRAVDVHRVLEEAGLQGADRSAPRDLTRRDVSAAAVEDGDAAR